MVLDVLHQLRDAIVGGENISINDTSIVVNENTLLDRKSTTNFKSLRGRGTNYTLEAVYFQYQLRDLPYDQYFQSCRDEQVPHVIVIDKKDLLAYLTGAIDTCPGLVTSDDGPTDLPHPSSLPAAAVSRPPNSFPILPDTSAASLSTTPKITSAVSKPPLPTENDEQLFSTHRRRVRDQRSIDSVLMVKDWDFSSLREKLSQHVATVKKAKPDNQPPKPSTSKPNTNTFDPRGDRYTSNEDRFWRENLGSEFHELGIDMSGSFKAKPSEGASGPPSNQPASNATRSRVDPGPVADRNQNQNRERSDVRRPSAVGEVPSKRTKIDPKNAIPIIMVPSGLTSLICSANALEFLRNGHFMSEEEMRRDKSKVCQTARATLLRKPGGNCSSAEYHIVSNPNRLNGEEWRQVVAVICSGQRWQFQSWPIYEGSATALFRNIQGFYFHYDDVNPTGEVESWPVKKLSISREKRHTDSQVQSQFWSSFDSFMVKKQSQLRY